jgi:hypothetical protein
MRRKLPERTLRTRPVELCVGIDYLGWSTNLVAWFKTQVRWRPPIAFAWHLSRAAASNNLTISTRALRFAKHPLAVIEIVATWAAKSPQRCEAATAELSQPLWRVTSRAP